MYLIDLLGRVNDYLEGTISKVDKYNRIETVREFLRLKEDGLSWTEIKQHLEEGCHCEEASGEEKKKILEYLNKD